MKKLDKIIVVNRSPEIMGILNVTPDSFSDGGIAYRDKRLAPQLAIQQALKMEQDGATIIDVGGESTRPGSDPVSLDEELARVIPIIELLKSKQQQNQLKSKISIDTNKPEVMQAAVAAGADMIKDVFALQADGAVETVAKLNVPVCLMHSIGKPKTMQDNPTYKDVVTEVLEFLQQRIDACKKAGIAKDKIIVDPGFGFGKTIEHNTTLLRELATFKQLEVPILVGISNKSMLGTILGYTDIDRRVHASVAAALLAVERGADIVRVHNVQATVDALKIRQAIL